MHDTSDRQTDRQKDDWMDRETDSQKDGRTDRQTERQTDRQTNASDACNKKACELLAQEPQALCCAACVRVC